MFWNIICYFENNDVNMSYVKEGKNRVLYWDQLG
jgi:hypothetical protein